MYKDGGFKGHEKSEGHTNAMYAWSEHQKNILTDSSVRDALDKAYEKKSRGKSHIYQNCC